MTLPNDLQGVQSCLKTSNLADYKTATVLRIHNTLCLDEIEVSENLLDQIRGDEHFEIVGEPYEMPFDENGNLFWGAGFDSDIIVSSVKALVSAVNRMMKVN